MSETTHIQTEVTDTTYEVFQELARERGLSLKSALREATEDWIEQQQQVDPDDPLFTLVAEAASEPTPDAPQTNASTEDDLVEEWSGDNADITLADLSDK
jgi:hypothetical protein